MGPLGIIIASQMLSSASSSNSSPPRKYKTIEKKKLYTITNFFIDCFLANLGIFGLAYLMLKLHSISGEMLSMIHFENFSIIIAGAYVIGGVLIFTSILRLIFKYQDIGKYVTYYEKVYEDEKQ